MLSSINVIINIMINVSLCLPRNQTSSNNLEIIEFLTNKKKSCLMLYQWGQYKILFEDL